MHTGEPNTEHEPLGRMNVYKEAEQPLDWIAHIRSSSEAPERPSKPTYGLDSPLGCLASNIGAPLYIYASLKGKHDLWDELLDELPKAVFSGPSLDMGCGRGMVLLKVAQRKAHLQDVQPAYAIDIFNTGDQTGNSPQATYANAASLNVLDHVVLHAASFTDPLPFIDGAFQLVTSSLALHNVDVEGRQRAIKELARVCGVGARVILVDLMGYVKGYADTLTELGWKEVTCAFGGVRVMFGMWPCQVLHATKPA